ncbi:MAG: NAD(P)H-dependent oxidoreductase subunit E [Gammaproteobacteria bacterium]|nr:NAD(P)H-dependent oxidoreductase subunit E [Gammaproteobacteria bacterium]MBU1653855.1 NAD(P)H-dependent oxidoreductase subunit E [Gammaproteobacteria bacterium]MBU1960418.1 NAD(P)H-dependent oxidoreductase subunit E [Gammaproteobacteria bacterium]
MFEQNGMALLEPILRRHAGDPTRLLQMLREVQEREGWVAPEAITQLADSLSLPRARVEGAAGFYSFLHTDRPCRYRILFSDNITDQMQGSGGLLDYLCGRLLVEKDHVSEDGLVQVKTTSCTGLCDQGPGLLVNGRAIAAITRERLDCIVDLILEQRPVAQWPAELFVIQDYIRREDILLGCGLKPGEALRAVIVNPQGPPLGVLEEIKASGLRGRGGAGFPTGLKWEACRNAKGERHYIVCNADEGEPGTFKDRVLLSRHADQVFEGMTLCAYTIGAAEGFLYLRGEYRFLLEPLEAVLARRRTQGLLGRNICGREDFDFDIQIHLGAGAYVCGEESALIESLEGKRGIPRNRPPYPVTHGYLQRPTTVNNVETFCAAALIALKGGDWYRAIGTPRSAGTKLLSISGDCARPGIYEYPFGITVRQILADCGAENTQAVQVSGPSGHCIDASEFDRRIAFEDLPSAGSFMIFDEGRDMFEVARSFVGFFAHESCGFCTPCRVGTSMLKGVMEKIATGHGTPYDLGEIDKLNRVLHQSAHCGLGQGACNPTLDTLKRFRPTYEKRLKSLEFEPAFDLDGALAQARRMTGRDDAGAHLGNEA